MLYRNMCSGLLRPCVAAVLFVVFAFSSALNAQEATVSVGGSYKAANKGALSVSLGQVAAFTYMPISVPNEGVQQPYPYSTDTIKVEVCQGEGYYEPPFAIPGSQFLTPGSVQVFQDTIFSGNSFGGDSIVVLQVTVNENVSQQLSVKETTAFFCEVMGSVTLYTDTIVNGDTLHFLYQVDSFEFQNIPIFDSLTPGTHTARLLAANACQTYISFTIDDKTREMSPTLSESHTDAYCDVKSTVTLSSEGGTSPFRYMLDGGDTLDNSVIENVASGSHTVIVVDQSGCKDTVDFVIGDSTAKYTPSVTVSETTDFYCKKYGTATVAVSPATGGDDHFSFKMDERDEQASPSFDSLGAGNHRVLVSDNNGCLVEQVVNIKNTTLDHAPELQIKEQTPAYCEVLATLTLQAVGGTAPYTYQMSDTSSNMPALDDAGWQSDAVFSNLMADTDYHFFVQDGDGCTAKLTPVSLRDETEDYAPAVTVSAQSEAYCNVLASATLSASEGAEPYSYQMDGGEFQSSPSFSDLTAGAHNAVVKDAHGCQTKYTVTIVDATPDHAPDFAVASKTEAFCNVFADLEMVATPKEGLEAATPYSYQLDSLDEQATPSFSGLAAGSHSVSVVDANGCKTTTNVTIDDSTDVRSPRLAVSDQSEAYCSVLASATLSATGGDGSYRYQMDSSALQTAPSFSGLAAGSHNAAVVDGNGCRATLTVVIADSSDSHNPSISVDTQSYAYCAVLAMLRVSAEGGVTPYTYKIDDGEAQASPSFTAVTKGGHTVMVIDNIGCQKSISVTIADSTASRTPSLSEASSEAAYCSVLGSFSVSAVGGQSPFSYQLGDGEPQAAPSFSNLAAGTYTVTVSDANSCTSSASFTVSDATAAHTPALAVSQKGKSYCDVRASLVMEVDGGQAPYSYRLDDNAVQSSPSFDNLAAGTYTIAVTDANNCASSKTVTIEDSTYQPKLSIASKFDFSCLGKGDITLKVNGGSEPYIFNLVGEADQDSAHFVNLAPDTYTAHIVDGNGCENTMDFLIKDITAYPTATVQSTTDFTCSSLGSVSIAVSGGTAPYTYLLDEEETFNSSTITGLYVGNHNVVVRGDDGCTVSVSFQILDITDDGPDVEIVSQTDATCTTLGSVTVRAAGTPTPYTYRIDDGVAQSGTTFTGLSVGRHVVEVTDAAGCKSYIDVNIADASDPGPVLQVSRQSGASCLALGSVSIDAFGGVGPYSYVVDGGEAQSEASFSDLEIGSHTVIVTGADGCSSSIEVSIVDAIASRPEISVASKTDAYCSDLGAVTLAVSGGTAPYTYQLAGGVPEGLSSFTGLSVGSHTAMVTDANGCTSSVQVTIDELSSERPTAVLASSVTAYCGVTGSATLEVSGGVGAYVFRVDDTLVFDNEVITGLTAGPHTVVITDANGCSTSLSVDVPDSAVAGPVVTVASTTAFSCALPGSATLSASGAIQPYTYWADDAEPQSDPLLSDLTAGVHTLYVADAQGCVSSVQVEIARNGFSLDVTAPADDTICQNSVAELTAMVTNGTAPYTYLWTSTPDGSGRSLLEYRKDVFVQPSVPTTYTVTVTDANGCEGSASTTVSLSSSVAFHTLKSVEECQSYTWDVSGIRYDSTGIYLNLSYDATTACTSVDSLVLTIFGGSHESFSAHDCYSYTWDRNGQTFTSDTTVIYRYTDINGCISADTLHVRIGSVSSAVYTASTCGSYVWNRVDGSSEVYTNSGSYAHDYIDSLGCPSTDVLNLTILMGQLNAYDVYTCNSYTWLSDGSDGFGNDSTYSTSGTYVHQYLDASGCLSADTLHLFMRYGGSSTVTRFACDSYTWVINGDTAGTFYSTGTYYHSFDDNHGCMGTDKLHLSLRSSTGSVEVHNVCDSLVWGDTTYRVSTSNASYTVVNAAGCDSIITLDIHVNHSYTQEATWVKCDSFFYDGTLYTEPASFHATQTTVAGCDSSVNVSLMVYPSYHVYDTLEGCDNITWNERTYTESASTRALFSNQYGCDSMVNMELVVNYSTTAHIVEQAELTYTIGDNTYVESGTYNIVLENSAGCDSLITLDLTIIPTIKPHIVAYEGKTVMINHYPAGLDGDYFDYLAYRWYHNGTLIPLATSDKYYKQGYVPLSGSYYVEVPTDQSMQTWIQSNVIDFGAPKAAMQFDNRFRAYPNPVLVGGKVYVEMASDESYLVEGSTIKVYDIQGRTVFSADVTSTTLSFVANFAKGVYTVVYQVPNRDAATVKLIVK